MRNIAESKNGYKMEKHLLFMTWDYKYDKESTWFEEDSGENEYGLIEGASYKLPHISDKNLEIRSVTEEGDSVRAEIFVDHEVHNVCNSGEPIVGYAHDD